MLRIKPFAQMSPTERADYVAWRKAQVIAIRKAGQERVAGRLPFLLGDISCVDCGDPALVYDHRDYTKPLDVSPVCRSCNHLRGPAIGPRIALIESPTLPKQRRPAHD